MKIISFDFLGLKVTFHFSAQAEIFARSLFKISDVSAGSLPNLVSIVEHSGHSQHKLATPKLVGS